MLRLLVSRWPIGIPHDGSGPGLPDVDHDALIWALPPWGHWVATLLGQMFGSMMASMDQQPLPWLLILGTFAVDAG